MAKKIHDSVDADNPCLDEKYGGFSCFGCDYLDKGYCQHDIERATGLYNADYRKQSENTVKVIKCKDCGYFFPYTEDDKADGNDVQGADGVCYMRVVNSDNRQFCACKYDDFCSYAKMKGGAE